VSQPSTDAKGPILLYNPPLIYTRDLKEKGLTKCGQEPYIVQIRGDDSRTYHICITPSQRFSCPHHSRVKRAFCRHGCRHGDQHLIDGLQRVICLANVLQRKRAMCGYDPAEVIDQGALRVDHVTSPLAGSRLHSQSSPDHPPQLGLYRRHASLYGSPCSCSVSINATISSSVKRHTMTR
jgi:hypothetical protein